MSRHAWDEAVRAFTAVDLEEPLAPSELELLAEASWWNGDPEQAVDTWERAFSGHVEVGDKEAAALVGLKLGEFAFRRGAVSVGTGWLTRVERLLEDMPPSAAHGWLLVERAVMAMMGGDADRAETLARQALEMAREHQDEELEALACSVTGTILVRRGHWVDGMAMIDEAAAAAGSGVLGPKTACDVYCITIATCCEATDYRRAGEWTEQVDRWMERQAIRGYRGECRIHRAELKRRQGAWSEAEQEARDACRELEDYRLMDAVGMAHYEIGEIRLRMGDLDGAESSFAAAYELGHDPYPGLALVMLARGDVDGAAAAMGRFLGSSAGPDEGAHPGDLLGRAMVLPAAVEVALAAGDLAGATSAAQELDRLADMYDSRSLQASARYALGAVALAGDHVDDAISELEQAWRLWRGSDMPYEASRARLLLGQARARAGDERTSRFDLLAARHEFDRLGAKLDLQTADGLLGEPEGDPEASATRTRKAFLFTDIVASTEIVGAIGDDAWPELLRWHDRVLREEFERHAGEVVKHTGDGFFAVFDRPGDAVRCALSIQRRLAEHRHQHGFAPQVRIGVHADEATNVGDDYAGQAVHIAARIAGLAQGGEILISDAVHHDVAELRIDASEARVATLKGVREPVEVREVHWRAERSR